MLPSYFSQNTESSSATSPEYRLEPEGAGVSAPVLNPAQIEAMQQRLHSLERENASLQRRLKYLEYDRNTARNDLRTIYSARYWFWLQRYWSLKRAVRDLRHGSLKGVKEVARMVLPLSAQQWMVRVKRRYFPKRQATFVNNWAGETLPPSVFDVVCFSAVDWGGRLQRPQQLLKQLAQAGHRVFYVDQNFRGVGEPYALRQLEENIYEVSLRGPALNIFHGTLTEAGKAELFCSLNALRRDLSLGATLSLVHLPFWWPLAAALREQFAWPVFYDCMDFHAGLTDNHTTLPQAEIELLKGADQVVVSSARLLEQAQAHTEKLTLIRNGCDYEHFAQVEYREYLPEHRPRIGYYGAISDWFDAELVLELARQRPDWDFVLIGAPVTAELKQLVRQPNIQLPGEDTYASLPEWLRQLDVLFLPLKRQPLTEAANPIKVYEILAAGKPLVSVPLPEVVAVNQENELVALAHTPADFITEIERALRENSNELTERRRAFARSHTWEARSAALLSVARACFPKASLVIVTYHNCELNRECLRALYERTEWPNFEVFVIDNASTDNTPAMLRELKEQYPNFNLVLNEQNAGFAKANNQGLRKATGDYLVLLNNDTIVTRGWLAGLIRHLVADAEIGLLGPVTNEIGNEAKIAVGYESVAEMPQWAQRYAREHDNQLFEIPMPAMFCVAMRRTFFEDIGELDEQFGVGMFEDDDYARRTRRLGFKLVCTRDVFIHHHGQASFKLLSATQYRTLFEENRLRFEAKWGERWIPHQQD